MKLEELLNEYETKHIKVDFLYVLNLMHYIDDIALLKIYETYPELFGPLSEMSEAEVLDNPQMILDAIEIFEEYLSNPKEYLSKEEFEETPLATLKVYMTQLVHEKSPELYKIIRELEEL